MSCLILPLAVAQNSIQPTGCSLGLIGCNYTAYYNTVTEETIRVPFVPCGQAYVLGQQITILGQPMTVLGV